MAFSPGSTGSAIRKSSIGNPIGHNRRPPGKAWAPTSVRKLPDHWLASFAPCLGNVTPMVWVWQRDGMGVAKGWYGCAEGMVWVCKNPTLARQDQHAGRDYSKGIGACLIAEHSARKRAREMPPTTQWHPAACRRCNTGRRRPLHIEPGCSGTLLGSFDRCGNSLFRRLTHSVACPPAA